MPKTSVQNTTDSLLCLWVEPLGEDYWLHPGEAFTVATRGEAEEAPFDTVVHNQGVTVVVNAGIDPEVVDQDGTPVPCGHQRPEGFDADSLWVTTWGRGRVAKGASHPGPPAGV